MSTTQFKINMLQRPEDIVKLLDFYNFAHIELKSREIRFARDENGGPNISIRLLDNPNLTVVDFVKGVHTDIFAYIMSERGLSFTEVINQVKKIFGFNSSGFVAKKTWFSHNEFAETLAMSNSENCDAKTYDESFLQEYQHVPNLRFYRDHISLMTQKKFDVLYNVKTQRIGIPIRNMMGELCGIKSRRNYDTDNENDPKYIYELPCEKSLLLYGFQENYNTLYEADVIYIGESEKFVMQCDSYGYHNAVAIMGSSLSPKQASLLLGLRAKKYCFMFDEGLEFDIIQQNVNTLLNHKHNENFSIGIFDYRNCNLIQHKDSATDRGKAVWEQIIKNYIKDSSILAEDNAEKIEEDDYEI